MNCKGKHTLEERQAAMRQRQIVGPVVQIPSDLIEKACDIFTRAIQANGGAARSEDVTARLVRAGINHSAVEQARAAIGIVESVRPNGEAWLRIVPERAAGSNSVVKVVPEFHGIFTTGFFQS